MGASQVAAQEALSEKRNSQSFALCSLKKSMLLNSLSSWCRTNAAGTVLAIKLVSRIIAPNLRGLWWRSLSLFRQKGDGLFRALAEEYLHEIWFGWTIEARFWRFSLQLAFLVTRGSGGMGDIGVEAEEVSFMSDYIFTCSGGSVAIR